MGTILPSQIYENPRVYPCYALAELRIGLGCVNKLWEHFPTIGDVGVGERGCKLFLFGAASNHASDEELVKLCEVLVECAGLIMIEGGRATLSTDWHIVGGHRGGNWVSSRAQTVVKAM